MVTARVGVEGVLTAQKDCLREMEWSPGGGASQGRQEAQCWAKGEHVGSEGASHAPGSRHCHLAEATEAVREGGRLSGAG